MCDEAFKNMFPCILKVIDKDQGNRKPSGLTMTQNIGKGQKQEKSILIAEGSGFIVQVIRDHKTNKQ